MKQNAWCRTSFKHRSLKKKKKRYMELFSMLLLGKGESIRKPHEFKVPRETLRDNLSPDAKAFKQIATH
jgi:hypothetical protein